MRSWSATIVPPRLDKKYVQRCLDCLTGINEDYLAEHPETAPLYESGVVYRREKAGAEEWLSIPHLYEAGFGDCEDLTCARTALLRREGVVCYSRVVEAAWTKRGWLYHVAVQFPDGSIEDPSEILGMKV